MSTPQDFLLPHLKITEPGCISGMTLPSYLNQTFLCTHSPGNLECLARVMVIIITMTLATEAASVIRFVTRHQLNITKVSTLETNILLPLEAVIIRISNVLVQTLTVICPQDSKYLAHKWNTM